MDSRGRSTEHLIGTTGLPKKQALVVLRGLERDGLAEHTAAGWRLTVEAERRYGWPLRLMEEWCREVRAESDAA